jgi:hypothetical protein
MSRPLEMLKCSSKILVSLLANGASADYSDRLVEAGFWGKIPSRDLPPFFCPQAVHPANLLCPRQQHPTDPLTRTCHHTMVAPWNRNRYVMMFAGTFPSVEE